LIAEYATIRCWERPEKRHENRARFQQPGQTGRIAGHAGTSGRGAGAPGRSWAYPRRRSHYRTFVENALTKARHAARGSGLPALADDAGLCVDAFGGLPGVDTAYYATQFGYEKSDDTNVRALLEQMQGIANRRAAMVSTLVAVRSADDPEPLIAVGRVVGEIAREPVGNNGFGFDPVMFIPEFGQTFAQLPVEVKNAHSHRGRRRPARCWS
jgi:XTP/dITP diphosphohydrolase